MIGRLREAAQVGGQDPMLSLYSWFQGSRPWAEMSTLEA